MSEIEKMYSNSGIEKCNRFLKPCPFGNECDGCEHYWYPEFTAEKQIELIKWLCQNTYHNYVHIKYDNDSNNWKIECSMIGIQEFENFDECLASWINNYLWQDLTREEKQQVKGILE